MALGFLAAATASAWPTTSAGPMPLPRRSSSLRHRSCSCWCACRCARCATSTFRHAGQDYLDIGRAGPALQHAARIWIANNVTIHEEGRNVGDGQIVAVRVSLPSDRSFASYDEALAHLTGPPLPDATDIPWNQAVLDVLLEYPIRSERSTFSIRPAFARLGIRVVTVLRFVLQGRHRARVRIRRRSRSRHARSPLAPGGLDLRQARIPPHPRRRRPPAVRVLPGDSAAPTPAADPRGDLIHRRAFDHPACRCRRAHAGRALVPAARRDADRGIDRLHGAREHRRGAQPSSGAGRSPSPSVSSTASVSRSR